MTVSHVPILIPQEPVSRDGAACPGSVPGHGSSGGGEGRGGGGVTMPTNHPLWRETREHDQHPHHQPGGE